jgi:hypothetical protein
MQFGQRVDIYKMGSLLIEGVLGVVNIRQKLCHVIIKVSEILSF